MFNYSSKFIVSNGQINEIWDFGINPVSKHTLGIDFIRIDLVLGNFVYGIDIFGVPTIWNLAEDSLVKYLKVFNSQMNLIPDSILNSDVIL